MGKGEEKMHINSLTSFSYLPITIKIIDTFPVLTNVTKTNGTHLEFLQYDYVRHTLGGLCGFSELLLSRVALHRQDLEDAV